MVAMPVVIYDSHRVLNWICAHIFICRRSRADLEVSFGVPVLVLVLVLVVVLEPLPLLSE